MDYDKIKGVFERLESRFGWQPIKEAGLTIGMLLAGTWGDSCATVPMISALDMTGGGDDSGQAVMPTHDLAAGSRSLFSKHTCVIVVCGVNLVSTWHGLALPR